MKSSDLTPIKIERAMEQLRQEQETFNQKKAHEKRWFALRLVMGYSSVILLAVVIIVASLIIAKASEFPASVVTAASVALFVDVIGLLICVWKIVLNPEYYAALQPVTQEELSEHDEMNQE